MKKSIRYYYFTSIATVLVISVMTMGLIQITLSSNYFREDKEDQLSQVVDSVLTGMRAGQIDLEGASRYTVNFMANMADAGVYVCDANGLVYFCTDKSDSMLGLSIPARVLNSVFEAGEMRELGRLGGIFVTNYYTVGAPLLDETGVLMGFVFASSDATGLKVYLSDTFSIFILSSALVLLVASILALFLTNRTVIPIRRISETARRFGEGDYSARVPVDGDDELAQLAITFNEMANSCESTDMTRRSFMGNIAHELRTPMTSIKGFIDGMLDGTIPENQRDKYLGLVSEEVGRLARLTQNMLEVSRLEAGEYTPKTTSFNIWGPITSVFLSAEQRVGEKQISIKGLEPESQLNVLADEDFVHQVLYNVIDNALKFTEQGGTITTKVQAARGFATISIRNSGAGIDEDTLPYIFDRFYKADQSRSINKGGSGLGLHICKVVINLMGGRIWAESDSSSYTEINFTLPLASGKKGGTRQWPL